MTLDDPVLSIFLSYSNIDWFNEDSCVIYTILFMAIFGFAFRSIQHLSSLQHLHGQSMSHNEDPSINTLRGYGRASLQRSLTIFTASTVIQLTPRQHANAFGGFDKAGFFDFCPDDVFLSSCVSSQDDPPSFFLPPWTYDGEMKDIKQRLLEVIINIGGTVLIQQQTEANDRYLAVQLKNSDGKVDECEFYFTPNDTTIQFRW